VLVSDSAALTGWSRAKTTGAHLRLEMAPGFADSALMHALEPLVREDRVLDLPRVNQSRNSTVGRLEVGGQRFMVKRYVERRVFLLQTFARPSRAQREARALTILADLIDNPVRPAAFAEQRALGMVPRSYIVTNELVDSVDLRRVRRSPDPQERASLRAVVLERLPSRVADIHRAGFYARTLNAKNVLFQRETETFAFIDLPRGRLHPAFDASHRLYDLACLYREFRHALTREEWRAFLARYQQAFDGPDEAEVDRALRATERLALQMAHLTPNRRRCRQLKKRFKRTPVGEFLTGHRYERSA
jgi:tRNA A-37 threonylcarbamoyl transferase component Bud32